MTKILVCGAAGRMGQAIIRLAREDGALQVSGALENKGNPAVGTGDPKITDDLGAVIGAADVLIDFTTPGATLEHLAAAVKNGKPVVIGTTAFSEDETKKIHEAAKKIPVVFAPNMSMGVNLLFRLAAEAAKALPGYDVEIVEVHHNKKKDAPSGTAAKIFEVIASALGRASDSAVFGRKGLVGERRKEEIGVHAVRAGDVVGDHIIYFAGPGERMELVHRAHSREPLAAGALRAAAWIVERKAGLYDMQDVLGLKRKGE